MLGNMSFRTELLIVGICCLPVVLAIVYSQGRPCEQLFGEPCTWHVTHGQPCACVVHSRHVMHMAAVSTQFACFFYDSPTKDLAPFSLHTPQKASFKLINDQFIVAGICWVQLNQPSLNFGW